MNSDIMTGDHNTCVKSSQERQVSARRCALGLPHSSHAYTHKLTDRRLGLLEEATGAYCRGPLAAGCRAHRGPRPRRQPGWSWCPPALPGSQAAPTNPCNVSRMRRMTLTAAATVLDAATQRRGHASRTSLSEQYFCMRHGCGGQILVEKAAGSRCSAAPASRAARGSAPVGGGPPNTPCTCISSWSCGAHSRARRAACRLRPSLLCSLSAAQLSSASGAPDPARPGLCATPGRAQAQHGLPCGATSRRAPKATQQAPP